jgi:hypothetical protein
MEASQPDVLGPTNLSAHLPALSFIAIVSVIRWIVQSIISHGGRRRMAGSLLGKGV